MADVPFGIAHAVITAETHVVRFEGFCNDLVYKVEGGRLVASTSANYDRGRDGRTLGRSPEISVCTSIEEDVDDKALKDIAKVKAYGTPPAKVYFCTSQSITEDRRIKLAEKIRATLPAGIGVEVLGGRQQADVCVRHPDLIERHYPGELAACLRALAPSEGGDTRVEDALQLALCAIAHEDSASIRTEVYRTSILAVLGDKQPRNVAEVARDLSARLQLAANLPEVAIRSHLKTLVDDGFVEEGAERHSITPEGEALAREGTERAAARLLEGRAALRKQIEEEVGYRLDDDHFARLWEGLQDRTAVFFYERGRAMVAAVSSLLDPATSTVREVPELAGFVEGVAAGAAATAADPQQAAELGAAVSDIFAERTGPAFDWLVRTATAFLSVCSLGLEATSGEQLRRAIAKMSLIPDTDVLLSFLCEGEPEHLSDPLISEGQVLEIRDRGDHAAAS